MKRRATAVWKGGPRAGEGTVSTGSGTFQKLLFTAGTSTSDFPCTCPSELLAAATASCVSLMVARELSVANIPADHVETQAELEIVETPAGWSVTCIELRVRPDIGEVDEKRFHQAIERAQKNCAISNALQVPIRMQIEVGAKK